MEIIESKFKMNLTKHTFSIVSDLKMKKNRNCQSGWWVVLLTATLAVPAMAEASVGLFNSKLKQVTTSSTLKWATPRTEAMTNYVVGSESEQGTYLTIYNKNYLMV